MTTPKAYPLRVASPVGTLLWERNRDSNRIASQRGDRMGQIRMDERWARRLLPLLAAGASNREIAMQLHVTTQTIKSYMTLMYRWLGARNRAHAVRIGYDKGLIGSATADQDSEVQGECQVSTPAQ